MLLLVCVCVFVCVWMCLYWWYVACILACVHNRNYNVKECEQPVQTSTWWRPASLYIDTFSLFTNNVCLLSKRIRWTRYPRVSLANTLGLIAQAVCMRSTLCFTAKRLVYTALFSHPEWTDGPCRSPISLFLPLWVVLIESIFSA